MVHCHDATVTEVWAEVFAHFQIVTVQHHSSMWNWLLAFQDEFFLKNPLDVKKKLWASSWLCSSPVSPFSVSESLDYPCMAYAFFTEHLSNHCQGLRRTFSKICTKCDAIRLSDPSQNCVRPDIQLRVKGRSTQLCEILYTDTQDMLVLLSTVALCYYNCCTDGRPSPGNYGYPITCSIYRGVQKNLLTLW
jgi:hypothetical protein